MRSGFPSSTNGGGVCRPSGLIWWARCTRRYFAAHGGCRFVRRAGSLNLIGWTGWTRRSIAAQGCRGGGHDERTGSLNLIGWAGWTRGYIAAHRCRFVDHERRAGSLSLIKQAGCIRSATERTSDARGTRLCSLWLKRLAGWIQRRLSRRCGPNTLLPHGPPLSKDFFPLTLPSLLKQLLQLDLNRRRQIFYPKELGYDSRLDGLNGRLACRSNGMEVTLRKDWCGGNWHRSYWPRSTILQPIA
jgi:hypothetical protein